MVVKKLQLQFSLQRGLTLIELLVVIAVVGILAAGLMTVLNPIEQIRKGQDTKRKSDLATVQQALEVYYQDNGSYPPSENGEIENNGLPLDWGAGTFAPYMTRLPADSTNGKTYFYISTGDAYWLFASLDRGDKDAQACNPTTGAVCTQASSKSAVCGSATDICNFGVSSPNVSPNN